MRIAREGLFPPEPGLTTFGPGAMVDLPDRAVLIEGLQGWHFSGGREEVQEPRLVAKLREKLGLPSVRLVKPPPFDERPGVKIFDDRRSDIPDFVSGARAKVDRAGRTMAAEAPRPVDRSQQHRPLPR